MGGTSPPIFPKYYAFMFSLRSPKFTLPLPRPPPFSKILDPPLFTVGEEAGKARQWVVD